MKNDRSAFPVLEKDVDYDGKPYLYCDSEGMSLLDYFAGQALAGLTVNYMGKKTGDIDEINSISELVQVSYNIAAAAIKEKEKRQ